MHAAAAVVASLLQSTLHALICCACLIGSTAVAADSTSAIVDTLLVNGRIVVFDGPPAEALAVRNRRIAAIGTSATIRAQAPSSARIVDLGGRTVIPGLIDSHIHAIRGGLTYTTEVDWTGVRSLAVALDRLRLAAAKTPKGSWLVVAGGWTERQFREDRPPTRAEIVAAAPDHRIYIQHMYSRVLLDPRGAEALGISRDARYASTLTVERDTNGAPTGWLAGGNRAISAVYDLLPRATHTQRMAGTRAFFRALNARGITGVLDPGGYNLSLDDYGPLLQLWREGKLTLRVRYSLSAPRQGNELQDFAALTAMLPMGFGDDLLRFNGIGENVTWGFYNNDQPDDAQKQAMLEVLRWAAARNMTATFHWHNDRTVHHLLDVLDHVDSETPLRTLRWSIAHLNDASPPTLARMQALGLGWLVQNAFYFRGEAFLGQRGAEAASKVPPLVSAARLGVPIGAGTDAHRVMGPNPFASLKWMLDGKTISGIPMRSAAELPSRLEALRMYTQGSAWFSFEEHERGALAVGQLADLAVLDRDYLTAPLDRLAETVSLLTMVGGRIVYAAGPYSGHEDKRP